MQNNNKSTNNDNNDLCREDHESLKDDAKFIAFEGMSYLKLGQFDKATIERLNQAVMILKESGDKKGEEKWLEVVGFMYYQQKQYERAVDYCNKALMTCHETDGEGEIKTRLLEILVSAYNFMGKHDLASIEMYSQAAIIYGVWKKGRRVQISFSHG